MYNSHKLSRLVTAGTLALGLVSVGVAASAQTTAAPAATTVTTSSNATTVSMSTTSSSKVDRKAELEQENIETRRIAFRHQGTSL